MDGTDLPDHVKAVLHALGNRTSKKDTGALILAMSDYGKAVFHGNSDAAERLLRSTAGGVSASEVSEEASAFRPDVIEVLPSADVEEGDA